MKCIIPGPLFFAKSAAGFSERGDPALKSVPFDSYITAEGCSRRRALITIDCTPGKCTTCGWNPAVEAKRKLKLRQQYPAP